MSTLPKSQAGKIKYGYSEENVGFPVLDPCFLASGNKKPGPSHIACLH